MASDDLWIGGGLLLVGGVFGFLNYKNLMDKKEIGKLAAAAQETARVSGIPISYIVAQAAHESNYGRSGLATKSNNLFGIKAGSSWTGAFDAWPTWEVIDGKDVKVQARFRHYDSWEDSVKDWYKLLQGSRYVKALAAARDHKASLFFSELQKAGYATDPQYSIKLVSILNSLGAIS